MYRTNEGGGGGGKEEEEEEGVADGKGIRLLNLSDDPSVQR